jgi:hypothetical protein
MRSRQEALLDEARRERLAATARGRRSQAGTIDGSRQAWRRAIGSVVIDLGIRLAGGSAEPATDLRG